MKAQFVFLSLLHAVFSLILFLFYDHSSIPTWAKERANPCDSVQLVQHTSESDGQHCGLVSGRKRSVITWEVGGGSANSSGAVRETESAGPLQPSFGQRIGCRKEFYGQPEAADKMLSVQFAPASYTKGPVSAEKCCP